MPAFASSIATRNHQPWRQVWISTGEESCCERSTLRHILDSDVDYALLQRV